MTGRPCPDCGSGWRYADELQGSNTARGLVLCPTCRGRGNIHDPTAQLETHTLHEYVTPASPEKIRVQTH